MISQGKCPKCEKTLATVSVENTGIVVGMQKKWRGISYFCPYCKTILSVSIDPVALKADVIEGVVEALRN
jgi:phage FluMu protein Com